MSSIKGDNGFNLHAFNTEDSVGADFEFKQRKKGFYALDS